jgi:hypothetical protein
MDGNKNTCAPTASAMLITAFMNEKHPDTRPVGHLEKVVEANTKGQKVKLLAKGMGTLDQGGTMPMNVPFMNNMAKYLKNNFRFKNAKEFTYSGEGSLINYPSPSQNDLINDIRKNKNGYLLTVTSHKEKKGKWVREADSAKQSDVDFVYMMRLGGHILALTGFNGDRLQIHDPWGLSYFVKAKNEELKTCGLCFKGKKTVLYPAGAKSGYISAKHSKGKKLILRQYFKMKVY